MSATSNDCRAWLVGWSLRSAGAALGLLFVALLTASVASAQSADLVVTKTDTPDPVTAGNNLTYVVTVTNNGPNAALNVTATDQLPPNTSFMSATVSQGILGFFAGTITANFGTVNVGTPATLTFVVQVNPGTPACTVIVNSATASSTTSDPNSANNTGTASTTVAPCPTATPTVTATATRTATPTLTVTPTPIGGTCILGDINCDGIVDIRDYGLWRQNFGVRGCGNQADLDRNCIVDIRDYGLWRQQFGQTAGATLRGEMVAAPRGTPGPVLPGSEQTVAGSRAPNEPNGLQPAVPIVPLVGGLLGLGGLAGWRRRRPPGSEWGV